MSLMLESPPRSAARPRVTAEELLTMPDGKDFELVNGELVERNMSWESERIGSRLIVLIGSFSLEHDCGEVNGSNAGFRCFEEIYPDDPDRLRKPDVSYISVDRVPKKPIVKGHCPIVPDLAVEVVSPNDLSEEVEEKVDEYLRAGVRLVWVVYPQTKLIRVHRANGTVQDLHLHEELSGEDVIPGFRCPVSEVFRLGPRPKS